MATVNTVSNIPDPTKLTLEFVHREILLLKESLGERIDAESEKGVQRYEFALEKINVQEVLFRDKFSDNELHRIEQKADTQVMTAAALAAVKESNAKSEIDTNRKLDAIQQSITLPISDMKERLTKLESEKRGGDSMKAGILAFAGLIIAVASLVGGFVAGKG